MLPWSPLKGCVCGYRSRRALDCSVTNVIFLPRGLLTGKFKRGLTPRDPTSSRVAWVEADRSSRKNQSHPSFSEYGDKDEFWKLQDTLEAIAKNHGTKHCTLHDSSQIPSPSLSLFLGEATVAQIAIAWLLHQPAVASVVIGARTVDQLVENLEAAHIQLTEQEVRCKDAHYYKLHTFT